MYGNAMAACGDGSGLSKMSMDELMKLATEGPRSDEERERHAHEEMAVLHARINALSEIVRRTIGAPGESCRVDPLGQRTTWENLVARMTDVEEQFAKRRDAELPPAPQRLRPRRDCEPMSSRLSNIAHELEGIAMEMAG